MADQHTPNPGRERIEELLRRSLEARAEDVRPDPGTWQTVSRRIRRGQTFRWALSGVTAVAAVVFAAVVLPGILNQGDVDLRPADPGGTPAPTETGGQPGVKDACGGPSRISAVLARDGEGLEGTLWARCSDGSESLVAQPGPGERHHSPAFAPDGRFVVFVSEDAEGDATLVHLDLATGGTQTLTGGRLPAFAPDGRLAWAVPIEQGQDRILVGRPFAEPEMEFPVVDGEDGEWFDVRRLAWDASGDMLYAEAGYEESIVLAYRLEAREPHALRLLEPQPDSRFAGPAMAAVTGEVAVVERCCSSVEGEPFTSAELRVLGVGQARSRGAEGLEPTVEAIATLPGDFDAAGAVWASPARVGVVVTSDEPGVGTAWSGGERPAWLVGDGTRAWLVQQDGTATLVAEQVSSAAANPAVGAEVGRTAPGGGPREQDGLPTTVAATRARIWQAAAARDYGALRALMAPGFSYSFGEDGGPDGAIAMLRDLERRGEDPFSLIQKLLRAPAGVQEVEGAPRQWMWPRPFTVDPAAWTGEDIDVLRALGAADEDLAAWRDFGGYIGWRLGIDETGAWRILVAGD